MEAALAQVESICAALQTSPQVAGAQLMELRSSPDALAIAKYVLEHSREPAAQFHATSLLQHVLLERHTEIPTDERRQWRSYLATFLVNHYERLATYVASQLLQTFAVLWKRAWCEEAQEAKAELFQQLHLLSKQHDKRTLSTRYLLALVSEFSSTSRSAAIGLPLEFHREAHRAFVEYGLLQVLDLSMAVMGATAEAVLQQPPQQPLPAHLASQLQSVSSLLADVLWWDFNGLDPLHEPTATTFISPPISWRPLLIRPDFITAMLEVYCRVRTSASLDQTAHSLRQLLSQLAAVRGSIFATPEDRAKYASLLLQGAMRLTGEALAAALDALNRGDQDEMERYGKETVALCALLQVCVSNFRLSVLAALPFFSDLLRQLASVSNQLLEATAAMASSFRGLAADFDQVEHGWTMEAFDHLLEAWVLISQDPLLASVTASSAGADGPSSGPAAASSSADHHHHLTASDMELQKLRAVVMEAAGPLYHSHLVCRITLGRAEAARWATEEEGEEGEVADLEASEQHRNVACLGRLAPSSALLTLKRMLLEPDSGGCLPRLHALMAGAVHANEAEVAALMEEVRVLVLALGHLLADDFDGESPAIPDTLHHLCFFHHDQQQQQQQQVSSSFASLLMEAVNTVMMLSKMLVQRILEKPEDPLLSPVLNEAVLWFLARWGRSYLLPDPDLYKNQVVAPALLAAYGPGEGAGGAALVDSLLQTAWAYLTRWPSEADVALSACRLLRALLGSPMVTVTLYVPSWRAILEAVAAEPATFSSANPQAGQQVLAARPELGYTRLSLEVRGELLEVLGSGVLAKEDATPMAADALMKVAGPLEARLQQKVLPALAGAAATAAHELEVVATLYAGLARSVDNSGQHLLSSVVTRVLEPLVQAVSVCRAYPEAVNAVLGLLRDYAEVHMSSLTGPETVSLLTASGHVLKLYAGQNKGRRRAEAGGDEDTYMDVLCVLKLLYHIVTKDFVDFSEVRETQVAADAISEVVFFGLRELMPLMSESLLDWPLLSKQYFLLINSMVSNYTPRVACLDHAFFAQLLDSVLFGIKRTDSEIARDSLRALAELAAFHAQAIEDRSSAGLGLHLQAKPSLLSDLLKTLLEMVVFEPSIWDRLDACAHALLALVMCDRAGFAVMVNGILDQLKPEVRERLRREFEELVITVPPVGRKMDRQSRAAFRERLKEFAKRVRPFMQMR